MNGRIWYDRRTQKYGIEYRLQDSTERHDGYDSEGRAQLAWLEAMYFGNGMTPGELGCPVPKTEGIETPNPLAKFDDNALLEEVRRRQKKAPGNAKPLRASR